MFNTISVHVNHLCVHLKFSFLVRVLVTMGTCLFSLFFGSLLGKFLSLTSFVTSVKISSKSILQGKQKYLLQRIYISLKHNYWFIFVVKAVSYALYGNQRQTINHFQCTL